MCLPLSRVPQAGWYEYDGLWEHNQRDQDFGTMESQKNPVLSLAISYRLPFNYLRQ